MTSTNENVEGVAKNISTFLEKKRKYRIEKAEGALNSLAYIILGFFYIIAFALFVLGAMYIDNQDESWWWLLAVLAVSSTIGFVGEIFWASIKIYVNISRSLDNIEERLRRIEDNSKKIG